MPSEKMSGVAPSPARRIPLRRAAREAATGDRKWAAHRKPRAQLSLAHLRIDNSSFSGVFPEAELDRHGPAGAVGAELPHAAPSAHLVRPVVEPAADARPVLVGEESSESSEAQRRRAPLRFRGPRHARNGYKARIRVAMSGCHDQAPCLACRNAAKGFCRDGTISYRDNKVSICTRARRSDTSESAASTRRPTYCQRSAA